jgi:hypothetical protein
MPVIFMAIKNTNVRIMYNKANNGNNAWIKKLMNLSKWILPKRSSFWSAADSAPSSRDWIRHGRPRISQLLCHRQCWLNKKWSSPTRQRRNKAKRSVKFIQPLYLDLELIWTGHSPKMQN